MEVQFFSMSNRPKPSKDVPHWSETVLVYEKYHDFQDFGYFDFETDEWHILGSDSMDLICWCYIPIPDKKITNCFNSTTHYGYQP